ncbi:MAG: hypothetical protein MK078_00065 [Crocinitomicaceae bacterium]|nr:hypothetical protein [Crocinitomicaceae bacterium]
MIYYTTYHDKDVFDEINRVIGGPYKLRELLKIGAVGSSRMKIEEYSPAFKPLVENNQYDTFASIGLRSKGILLTVSKSHNNICWAIPYYRLSIYKTEVLSIHAEGQFLKLNLKKNQNKKFIAKLLDFKAKYHQEQGG